MHWYGCAPLMCSPRCPRGRPGLAVHGLVANCFAIGAIPLAMISHWWLTFIDLYVYLKHCQYVHVASCQNAFVIMATPTGERSADSKVQCACTAHHKSDAMSCQRVGSSWQSPTWTPPTRGWKSCNFCCIRSSVREVSSPLRDYSSSQCCRGLHSSTARPAEMLSIPPAETSARCSSAHAQAQQASSASAARIARSSQASTSSRCQADPNVSLQHKSRPATVPHSQRQPRVFLQQPMARLAAGDWLKALPDKRMPHAWS